MKRILLCGLLTAIPASTGCRTLDSEPSSSELARKQTDSRMNNRAAPDFELTALSGEKVRLSGLQGKPVLLAFFGLG